jgi:hypothetical protein
MASISVLAHLAEGATADRKRRGHVEWVGAHENDVGGLDGDVRSGADGDPQVCVSRGWRIIDAVAGHGHLLTGPLQVNDLGGFVARQHLSDHRLDPELARDPPRRRTGLTQRDQPRYSWPRVSLPIWRADGS